MLIKKASQCKFAKFAHKGTQNSSHNSISCAHNGVRALHADRGIDGNVMSRHIPVKMMSFRSTHANRMTG